jgi:hypothetical protein
MLAVFARNTDTWDYPKTPPTEQISSDDQGGKINQYVECISRRICREFIKNGRLIFLFFMSDF